MDGKWRKKEGQEREKNQRGNEQAERRDANEEDERENKKLKKKRKKTREVCKWSPSSNAVTSRNRFRHPSLRQRTIQPPGPL